MGLGRIRFSGPPNCLAHSTVLGKSLPVRVEQIENSLTVEPKWKGRGGGGASCPVTSEFCEGAVKAVLLVLHVRSLEPDHVDPDGTVRAMRTGRTPPLRFRRIRNISSLQRGS